MPRPADFARWLTDPRVVVPLLTLTMAVVTGRHVFVDPLWGDELRTWRDGIERPLIDLLTWRHNADHAPLGHLMARAGAAIFGVQHAWALRLGSWLCGIACVPVAWWAGRNATGRGAAGLLVALMLVVDPTEVHAATQARMYSALLLSGMLAIGFAASLLSRQIGGRQSLTPSIGLTAALAVGIWSHSQIYAVLVPILVLAIVRLAVAASRDRRLDGVALGILLAVLAALLGGIQGILKLLSRRDIDPLDAQEVARPFAQLEDATRSLSGQNWMTAIIVIAAITGFIVLMKSRRAGIAWLLIGVVVMAVVDLLIAARYRPVGFARYLTLMQPALWIGIAACVTWLWSTLRHRALHVALITTFAAALAYQFSRTLADAPPPVAAQFRDALRHLAPDEGHLLISPRPPFMMDARYYGRFHDDAAFDAIVSEITVRRERGRHASPTTQQSDFVAGHEPITIVGIVPARDARARSAEDPLVLVETIARARGLTVPTIPTPDGTLRVVVVRFMRNGAIEVDDPNLASVLQHAGLHR